MKQLIVTAAILPILIAFVAQFTQQNLMHARLVDVESSIHRAKIVAEAEGGFSSENENNLRADLSRIMKVNPSEVLLELEKNVLSSEKSISYRIGVPTGEIIAYGQIFRISKSENKAMQIFEGSIPNLYYYIEKYKPEKATEELLDYDRDSDKDKGDKSEKSLEDIQDTKDANSEKTLEDEKE